MIAPAPKPRRLALVPKARGSCSARWQRAIASLLLLWTLLLPSSVRAAAIAATSENPLVTEAALDQMRAGGNAVDAAVTAALVAGVVSPTSSGIGGGGFAMVRLQAEARTVLLDFRETAPRELDASAFEARPLPAAERGKYVGVPGEVAGLYLLHQRYGRLPWQACVRPAIRLAELGFKVGTHLGRMLQASRERLMVDAELARRYFPGGRPAREGQTIRNPTLAATLREIEKRGPPAFYTGPIAAEIVRTVQAHGGRLSLLDLATYQPVWREPLRFEWEGYEVFTMPPPSAGGLMVAQTLGLFSSAYLQRLGLGSGAYHHMLAESLRGAIADRMRYLGDPDHQPVALDQLLAPARLARRRASLALDRTHALPRFGLDEHGTHHLVTSDADGNMVSLTTTINRLFGAKLTTAHGIVLNDELNDFNSRKDVAAFGMSASPNRPRPGARPLSSMTPTIVVRDGRAVLGIGGSGGPAIPTNVTQVLVSRLAFGTAPEAAVRAPRIYIFSAPLLMLLDAGIPAEQFDDLRWRGEIVDVMKFTGTAVQMIAVDPDGTLRAAADPRKFGSGRVLSLPAPAPR